MLKDLWLVLTGRLSSTDYLVVAEERDYFRRVSLDETSKVALYQMRSDNLTTTILAMDEELFRIQQCTSWDRMLPIFNRLWADAEKRRRHVSNKIGEREIARIKSEAPQEDVAQLEEYTDQRAAEANAALEEFAIEESRRIKAVFNDTANRLRGSKE